MKMENSQILNFSMWNSTTQIGIPNFKSDSPNIKLEFHVDVLDLKTLAGIHQDTYRKLSYTHDSDIDNRIETICSESYQMLLGGNILPP